MNLVIGLFLGAASAVALVIMWRMAEHWRKEMERRDNQPVEKDSTET